MASYLFGWGNGMNQIKIAHITTVDIAFRLLLLNQLRYLQAAGYKVEGISADGPYANQLKADGIHHIPVEMTRNFTPLADLIALWHLYRVLRQEKYTIVHTHTPKAGLLGQLAARLAGVPVVINTVHGFYFNDHMPTAKRRFYITIEKIAARCSDVILSQNQEDIHSALCEGICRPEKIKHLGNGIDLRVFDPARFSEQEIRNAKEALGIPPAAPVVGFVGRLAARRKGFLDFLAAGQLVSQTLPEVRFLIIGDTDYGKPDAVEPTAARNYNIAEHCIFLGQRPNRELPIYYRMMNLLVLPSLFEGIPRVVMEASAMQIPAVVSDVKGNREAVEHDRNGLRVPLGNVPLLAENILALLVAPERARLMGEEGRRMALDCFDEQIVFKRITEAYAELLSKKGLSKAEQALLVEEIRL
jgi:glycosyltransferase involved in cell wall biosynthesis